MLILPFVLVCLLVVSGDHSLIHWHGYNSTLLKNISHPLFLFNTKPYSDGLMKRLSLWNTVRSEHDIRHGSSLFGSEAALEEIFAHQNPEDCSKAKYIVSGGWPYGFGARIHMEGVVLALALETGRVYLPHPDGDNIMWETDIPFCSQNRTSREVTMQCFYLPASRCTIKDALKSAGVDDVNKLPTLKFENFEGGLPSSLPDSFNLLIQAVARGKDLQIVKFVPTQFRSVLQGDSPLRRDAHHYWWRAVSATFLLRPNGATLAELERLSKELVIREGAGSGSSSSNVNSGSGSSCVAMFVRHGDKGSEMKLLDWSEYRDAAVRMWREGLLPTCSSSSSSSSSRQHSFSGGHISGGHVCHNVTLFITTEDEAVLTAALNWSSSSSSSNSGPHWRIAFTSLFDRTQQVAAKSYEELVKVKNANRLHHPLEYLSMLLNLQYALQCEAWVCTLASNSCRIIDELRCTVGSKCNRHYADLSGETCSEPPCMAGGRGHILNFGT